MVKYSFSMENTNNGLEVESKTVNEKLKQLLPLDLELTNSALKDG